jgi:hypothetical protein
MGQDRDERDERGFRVDDRRLFEADGTVREGAAAEAAPGSGATPASAEENRLPEIDFSTFILSITTSAMVHLGEAPHPDGATRKDLTLAKQTIDLLGMLKEKTAGNLTEEESKLLEEVLYDLRLRYVGTTR